jgi:hypothetical protein
MITRVKIGFLVLLASASLVGCLNQDPRLPDVFVEPDSHARPADNGPPVDTVADTTDVAGDTTDASDGALDTVDDAGDTGDATLDAPDGD